MKPKRVLLLYCADADRRSELAYVLDVRGYRVVDLDTGWADVALVVHDSETSEWAANHISKRFPETPIIVLLPKKGVNENRYMMTSRILRSTSTVELLESLRIAAVRKRGPKRDACGRLEYLQPVTA